MIAGVKVSARSLFVIVATIIAPKLSSLKVFWRRGRDLNSRGIAPTGFPGPRYTGLSDLGCLPSPSGGVLELFEAYAYYETFQLNRQL